MRIERLIEIIILLLNRDTLSGRQLAEHFSVSLRTIQRDMDALSLAGIPIVSTQGLYGGYSILDSYKLENAFVKKEDFRLIIMALRSLGTSYDNEQVHRILDKYLTVNQEHTPPISIDYGVIREGSRIQSNNQILEQCIDSRRQIAFTYINPAGHCSQRQVKPYALQFKWYSWYLFGYDMEKEDCRIFKVARMRSLLPRGENFTPPANLETLLSEQEKAYYKKCEHILVSCTGDHLILLEENFPDAHFQQTPDGKWLMDLFVPLSEPLWQALILGLSDKIEVLAPAHYREMLVQKAQHFIKTHNP